MPKEPKIRPRNIKKLGYKKPNKELKRALPIIELLQNYEKYKPHEVMEILSYMIDLNNNILLDDFQRNKVAKYLNRWGYSSKWLYEKSIPDKV